MPTYKFLDTNTGKEFDVFMSISERDVYLKNNPNLQQLVNGFPSMADPTRVGLRKPDDGFKDVLKEIKGKHRKSTINTW
jgi:hypothetical protein